MCPSFFTAADDLRTMWNGRSGSSMLPLLPFHKNIIAKSVAMRNQIPANTSPARLLQVKATIYIERCASNIIPIYNEIANSASHLLSCTDTAERYPRHNRLLRLIWHRLEHLRCYKTGTDGIDRDIGASQLQRSRFGETNDASFGGCIVS